MRKLLIFIITVSIGSFAQAQVVLDKTFYKTNAIGVNYFSNSGTKYSTVDTGTKSVTLYNTDLTTWKTLNIPAYLDYKKQGAQLISDNLFNSDNNLEYVATYVKYDGSTYPYNFYHAIIYDESGATILDLGDAIIISANYVDGKYKLITSNFYTFNASIYSLPGTLPCSGPCGSSGTGFKDPTGQFGISSPAPNPSSGSAMVSYTLPAGTTGGMITVTNTSGNVVAQVPVTGNSGAVNINNGILPSGVYYYSLTAENMPPSVNKMVVIQ